MPQYEPLSRDVLLKAGSCCGSRCQNCPYEPRHEEGTTVVYKKNIDAQWQGWPDIKEDPK